MAREGNNAFVPGEVCLRLTSSNLNFVFVLSNRNIIGGKSARERGRRRERKRVPHGRAIGGYPSTPAVSPCCSCFSCCADLLLIVVF